MDQHKVFYDIPKNMSLLMEESLEVIEVALPLTQDGYFDMPSASTAMAVTELENELGDFLAIAAIAIPDHQSGKAGLLLKLVNSIGNDEDKRIGKDEAYKLAYDLIHVLTIGGRVASKCIRFGIYHGYPEGARVNIDKLKDAVSSVVNLIIRMDRVGIISTQNVVDRIPVKYARLSKHYHGYNSGV